MTRVLVTGGSGFIGSAIVRLFATAGHEVIVPYRSAGVPPRLADLPESASLVPGISIEDPDALGRTIQDLRPSWIVHAAAAGVRPGSTDAIGMASVNVVGTVNVIEMASKSHVDRVVLLGSGFEYEPSEGPLDEATPLGPTTLYGATKAASSLMARFFRDHNGLDLIVARFFSTYGPRESLGRFVPYVVTRALDNAPIEMSAGNQVRDYLFVDEAAEAILRLLELDGRPPAVVNVVGPEQQTLREVAEQIVELAGSRSTLHFGAREPYPADRASFIGDGGRLQEVLGWHPARGLRAGMDETIEWYRKNRRQWMTL